MLLATILGAAMSNDLAYQSEAAAEYDRAFAHVSRHFLPNLLKAAAVAPGMKVLDIATGTGLAAEELSRLVGPVGRVVAADLSKAMVDQAKQRLGALTNLAFTVEDGQALSLADASFDALTCSLGLMFFPDPLRGLSEFRRVLRPGARAAVSVLTVPERSYNGRINAVIARHLPELSEATARTFSLGDEPRLRVLFETALFDRIEISRENHRFTLPSFEVYFSPFERGGASTGQAFLKLPPSERAQVREEVRRSLGDTGGPIEIEVEFQFASGER